MYAARSTIAREPRTLAPLVATTGVSRQNTPMGESLRMTSMTFMNTRLRRCTPSATGSASLPTRIMPKPMSSAMTMICSIEELDMGVMKLEGKMLTTTSMMGVGSAAS